MTEASMDRIRYQVMWDRLLSVVEEQAQTLVRTAFSTSAREAGDISAGVFDLQGQMLAQAVTGTPGHINSMARSVVHFLDVFPADGMQEGDVYLTNDPWKGTGHLHDFTVVSPAFRNDRLVALFACTSHVVDIGGIGMSPDGRQDHALRDSRQNQRMVPEHGARQCARTRAGGRRSLRAGGLQ